MISVTTSCARGDTIYMPHQLYVGRCGPDAAAQLQPISYVCGAQCILLPRPATWPLTFWPWKYCPSHVWRGLP